MLVFLFKNETSRKSDTWITAPSIIPAGFRPLPEPEEAP